MAPEIPEKRENIVSIFFVGAEQPLFDGDEVPIGETRCGLMFRALFEGRHIDQNFIGGGGNQLQSLAAEIIVNFPAILQELLKLIISILFLKARGDGRDRGHPMRLARLRRVDAIVPGREIIGDRVVRGDGRFGLRVRHVRRKSSARKACGHGSDDIKSWQIGGTIREGYSFTRHFRSLVREDQVQSVVPASNW